jgi:Peptidase_G2, IMC autoproteolytic cleavage domain
MTAQAGYAEMFEWADGNPDNEDRAGLTVVIAHEDKIRAAMPGETPIGVIGGDNTSVAAISNASPTEWHNKHKRDAANRLLWESQVMVEWVDNGYRHWYEADRLPEGVTVPPNATYYYELNGNPLMREILTEEFTWKDQPQYLPRWERREWAIVVLLGRAIIREGQPCKNSWIRLKTTPGELGGSAMAEWLLQ